LGAARAEALRGAGGQAPNLKVIWDTGPVDVKEFLRRNRNQTP
jgi:predicted oxidoreductase